LAEADQTGMMTLEARKLFGERELAVRVESSSADVVLQIRRALDRGVGVCRRSC
jgi:hypothetical protein